MKKKGILGGTFDPIHNGHLYIASEALKTLALDEVIFVPAGNPPHKRGKSITDAYTRYEMVNMAIRGYDKFSISNYEIEKKGYSYTYETLQYFKSVEPCELYFITGADCLMYIDKWKESDKIFENCSLVVFNRPGFTKEEIIKEKQKVERFYGHNIIYMDLLNIEISSSYIRDKIKEGFNVEYFMPPEVYNTIKTLGIYKV